MTENEIGKIIVDAAIAVHMMNFIRRFRRPACHCKARAGRLHRLISHPDEVETKLINLAKSLARKIKTGQDWNSDYKVI